MRSSQSGITIFELLLVLAIGAAIIIMSMRMYMSYKKDSEYRVLEYNVNLLFQAASNYYYAQCSRPWDAIQQGPLPWDGLMDPGPESAGWTKANISGPMKVDYTAAAFTEYLPAPLQVSALVDTTGGTTNPPYVVQFNPKVTQRTVDTQAGSVSVGSVLIWEIQVSANLSSDLTKLQLAKSYLAARCNTSLISGVARTCDVAPASSNPYLAWTRLPGTRNANIETEYWLSNPRLIQFKQMYITYPITYLTGQTTSMRSDQYYLCGS